MRRALPLWVLLAACSAANMPSTGHETPQAVLNDSVAPPLGTAKGSTAPLPPRTAIPGGPGFWCAEFRGASDDQEFLGACYRAEPTCKVIRQKGLDDGHSITSCEVRREAHCFTMSNNREQAMYWRCYKSTEHCRREREKYLQKQPALHFGDCDLTASSAWSRPNSWAARL